MENNVLPLSAIFWQVLDHMLLVHWLKGSNWLSLHVQATTASSALVGSALLIGSAADNVGVNNMHKLNWHMGCTTCSASRCSR